MDFHPPQHSSAISCQGFSTFLVFIRWQRWTTTACLRNPRRLRQRMCNLRVLMALRLLGRIRGCRWMLVEGFGCRWFGNVWECLWFPMIFQSFLQHLWTLGENGSKPSETCYILLPFAGHKDPEMNGTSTVEETKETGSKGLQPTACPNNAVGCRDTSFIL